VVLDKTEFITKATKWFISGEDVQGNYGSEEDASIL
jgi:hypothetical protein